MATPLTDAINALTTYANSVTGASDTTLSDAVDTLADGYGQGSSSMQSGSFVGEGQTTYTFPVTSLCSHIYVWAVGPKSDDDISSAPYGGDALALFFADGNNGFCDAVGTSSAGTAWETNAGTSLGIGRWGGNTGWVNRVEFATTTIKIINPSANGRTKKFSSDRTYNWLAW